MEPSTDQQQSLVTLYRQGQFNEVVSQTARLLEQLPNSIFLLNTLAGAYASLRQFDSAIASLKKVLEIKPDFAEVYLNMGSVYKDCGDLEAAIASYKQALKIKPDFVEANYHLGNVMEEQGDLEAATTYYRQALKIKPDFVKACFNMGNVMSKQRNLEAAIAYYQQVLKIRPDFVNAYFNMGNVLWEQGNTEAAIGSLKQALKIKPDHARSYSSLLEILEQSNRTDEFSLVLEQAKNQIEILPDELKFHEAMELWRKNNYREALDVIDSMVLEELPENNRPLALNLKGKCCDKLKKFDEAFECFAQMNEIRKSTKTFQECNPDKYFSAYNNQFKQLQESSYEASERRENLISNNQQVFLVGFPRSGTTLLDTILRSHSRINVVEEKLMLEYAKHSIRADADLEKIENLNDKDISIARNAYFIESGKHTGRIEKDHLVIDKLPLNILETPLIHKLFPESGIVLAVRHPLDSILSCWMQDFKLNDAMANMVDLERIVDLYCLAMNTLKASQSRYNLKIHTIKYENIVQDLKGEVNALLKFLGLAWENQLEDYRDTALKRNRINTPSYSQVVQPLYRDSTYRWKNYRKYLEFCFPKIKPWVKEFGYEL